MSNTPSVKLSRAMLGCATYGFIEFDDKIVHTLELPWKMNEQGASCIHPGVYRCVWNKSPSLGVYCYEILNVYGRSGIRIHSGNFTRQIQGCILVGDSHRDIDADGVPDVTNSKATLEWLHNRLGDEFFLNIV